MSNNNNIPYELIALILVGLAVDFVLAYNIMEA